MIADAFGIRGSTLATKQIFTVGSNPLPILVTARALRPETVWLLYTKDVEDCKRRLEVWLKKEWKDHGAAVKDGEVKAISLDARDPAKIKQVLDAHSEFKNACKEAGLHYSGGTKVMAVQAYNFWRQHDGDTQQASYLGSDGRLRFEFAQDTMEFPLQDEEDLQLPFDTLCELHLAAKSPKKELNAAFCVMAQRIWEYVRQHGLDVYHKLLPPYYGDKSQIVITDSKTVTASYNAANPNNFCANAPFRDWPLAQPVADLCEIPNADGIKTIADVYQRMHGVPLPSGSKNKNVDAGKKCEKLAKSLYALWLEVWLADWLEKAKGADDKPLFHEVRQDVEVKRNNGEVFQADVVAMRGYIVYLFSCTVDTSKSLIKSKLFEARQRADQLGGEHARCAVVSFSSEPEKILCEIREQGWSGYDEARSFGRDHIQKANEEKSPLLGELHDWIKSS